MKTPSINWADLYSLGVPPETTIDVDTDGVVTIVPTPHWVVLDILAYCSVNVPPSDNAGYILHLRRGILKLTDWTQGPDVALSPQEVAAWREYRAAIRAMMPDSTLPPLPQKGA